MFLLAKYNVQTTFEFPMIKRGAVDFAVAADWTPASGDTKITKDGGAVADTTNNPAAVSGTGSALWSLTLTAAELSAARITVQIVDSATKAVEDQALIIYTFGNASAKIPFDLSADLQGRLPVALVSGRMDASIGAVAANAITDAGISTDLDVYQAKVWIIKDGSTTDYYGVGFFKNGQPIFTGVTSPTIQVIKASDGTDLIASTALTEIGSLGIFKKDEATNKLVAGAMYFAKVTATIDGATRSWIQQIGRDA